MESEEDTILFSQNEFEELIKRPLKCLVCGNTNQFHKLAGKPHSLAAFCYCNNINIYMKLDVKNPLSSHFGSQEYQQTVELFNKKMIVYFSTLDITAISGVDLAFSPENKVSGFVPFCKFYKLENFQ